MRIRPGVWKALGSSWIQVKQKSLASGDWPRLIPPAKGKNGSDTHVSGSQAQDTADLPGLSLRLPCSLPASPPFRARLQCGIPWGSGGGPLPASSLPTGERAPNPNALWSPLAEPGLHLGSRARPLLNVHLLKILCLLRCPCGTGKNQFESREAAALKSHVG